MSLIARAQKAFTLIELLVVISIISLLSSVVLGNLRSAKSQAEDTATMAVLRQFEVAVERYIIDNGDQPTSSYDWSLFGKYYGEDCSFDPGAIINDELAPYLSSDLAPYISDGGCIFYRRLDPNLGYEEEYMILALMKTDSFLANEPTCLSLNPSYSTNDMYYCVGVDLD